MTRNYPGSNRLSRMCRSIFEHLPIKQLIGLNLATAVFATSIILPQADLITSTIELRSTPEPNLIIVGPSDSTYQWPLSSFNISQRFSFSHPGIDLATQVGTPIYPVAGGQITSVNHLNWGYGNHLLITHPNGITSLYAHLNKIRVTPGETIQKQTILGTIGSTGWSTGNHLHLEIYTAGTPVNPLEVLPTLSIN